MSSILIENGIVVTMTGDVLEPGSVLVEGTKIKSIFPTGSPPEDIHGDITRIDASRKLVMPGFINAHHHLYSTMARGMAIPGDPPANFREILERLWWRLDYCLNEDDVYLSSLVPLLECVRNGTTSIIDHHASPSCRDGSLDIIRKAVEETGIRASLCYEISDRNEPGAGIRENERFLESLRNSPSPLVSGMVGMHASVTLSDDSIEQGVALAKKFDTGCHIHVAEARFDEDDCYDRFGCSIVERLRRLGVTGPKSILAHCIWIDETERKIIADTDTMVVHQPESNMNNAVGVSKILDLLNENVLTGLGTDGMSSDMPAQMRCCYLLHRLANNDPRVGFLEAPKLLLENNRKIFERVHGLDTGTLEPGKPADLIVLDYDPPTPLTTDNFLGHLIFGIVDATVDTTICNGKILMKNKEYLTLDEEMIMARSRELAPKMWERLWNRFS